MQSRYEASSTCICEVSGPEVVPTVQSHTQVMQSLWPIKDNNPREFHKVDPQAVAGYSFRPL